MKWEYAVAEIHFDGKYIWISDDKGTGKLDEDMGHHEWELVNVVSYKKKMLGFFKRQYREGIRAKRPIIFIDDGPMKDPIHRWIERVLGNG